MPTTTPRLSVAIAFALSLLVPQAASAGPLAPTKPSQVVNVTTDGITTLCNGGGAALNTAVRPDGTTAPFTIPAGQVLVVTGFSWIITTAQPSQLANASLAVDGTGGPLFWDAAVADPVWGWAGRWVSVPNVVIKSGQTLCARSFNGLGAFGQVYGFFAKDK